jgi:hypothetical protein
MKFLGQCLGLDPPYQRPTFLIKSSKRSKRSLKHIKIDPNIFVGVHYNVFLYGERERERQCARAVPPAWFPKFDRFKNLSPLQWSYTDEVKGTKSMGSLTKPLSPLGRLTLGPKIDRNEGYDPIYRSPTFSQLTTEKWR